MEWLAPFAVGAAEVSMDLLTRFFPKAQSFPGALNSGIVNAYLSCPLLHYFPIYCEKYTVKHSSDVAVNMIIAQGGLPDKNGGKLYAVDNVAPHPRQWVMKGYLMPLIPIDGTIFQPTLTLQKEMLQAARMSREPISFKTRDNEFVEVLINDMTYEETPQSQAALGISLTVTEFITTQTTNLLDINVPLGTITTTSGIVDALGTAVAVPISMGVLAAGAIDSGKREEENEKSLPPTIVTVGEFNTVNGKKTVTITSNDSLNKIYYTTNGITPTVTEGQRYRGAFTLDLSSEGKTVRALIVNKNSYKSSVAQALFKKANKLIKPTLSIASETNSDGSRDISATVREGSIHYTLDGTTPTGNSPILTGVLKVDVSEEAKVITILAYKEDSISSDIVVGLIQKGVYCKPVSLLYNAGLVTLTGTEGATIKYSLDGTEPSIVYSKPFAVASGATIKCKSSLAGLADSPVQTFEV